MIRTAQLRYRYAGAGPGAANLHFPDVDLAQGGMLLLRGNSGSGKSTWLALACALLRPTSGQMWVAGQELAALTPVAGDAWRALTIGFLPQQLHLSAALPVHDNLALVFYAAGLPVDGAAITWALDALGVADVRHRLPGQLSGGQAQRVALARALLRKPRVILADEPTASLDDTAAQAALGLLHSAAQTCSATLVIATHDARVVQAMPQAQVLQLNHQPHGLAT